MRIPTEIICLISSFNGTDEELRTERGLRFMFLLTGKFFSWGLGDRDETLHKFLELYDIRKSKALVDALLWDEATWMAHEKHWASESEYKAILHNIRLNETENSSDENQLFDRKTSVQKQFGDHARDRILSEAL